MLVWTFSPNEPSPVVVVLVPVWGAPGEKFPVVFAFHGRGEALKTPWEGAMGWARDYGLTRAFERLRNPPLTTADFEGFVTAEDLANKNEELSSTPYRGVIVVCPFVADANARSEAQFAAYAPFLREKLLPRLAAETPAIGTRDATGIDGISQGGSFSLRVGLAHPEIFGAVSAIQAAIGEGRASQWVELAKASRARNPKLKLRLLTSYDDSFRMDVTRTSEAWRAAGIEHDFTLVPGPHDYPFNRGPGSYELLTWHDRVLARG
jgi:iron(III)-salmochelin esterase